MYDYDATEELYHHGIKGQKWGIRRYQNPDGSLTEAGRKKYGAGRTDKGSYIYNRKHGKAYNKLQNRVDKINKEAAKVHKKADAYDKLDNLNSQQIQARNSYRRAGEVLDTAAILEKKAMNKTLKELGMSKKEIEFCKTGREYTKYLEGSKSTRILVGALGGSIGGAAYVGYRAGTQQGKELGRKYNDAAEAYRKEYKR